MSKSDKRCKKAKKRAMKDAEELVKELRWSKEVILMVEEPEELDYDQLSGFCEGLQRSVAEKFGVVVRWATSSMREEGMLSFILEVPK